MDYGLFRPANVGFERLSMSAPGWRHWLPGPSPTPRALTGHFRPIDLRGYNSGEAGIEICGWESL